jgi:hypothetical protein
LTGVAGGCMPISQRHGPSAQASAAKAVLPINTGASVNIARAATFLVNNLVISP